MRRGAFDTNFELVIDTDIIWTAATFCGAFNSIGKLIRGSRLDANGVGRRRRGDYASLHKLKAKGNGN